jgi:SPP1 family predicted phage head-tail adaptor
MMPAFNPREFRTQVQFQAKAVTSQDSYGQDVFTWVTQFTAWCEVRALVGREIEAARQLNAEAKFKIRTHFPTTVTVKREWRAVMGTRILNIIDAEDPTGERRELVITASEWVE